MATVWRDCFLSVDDVDLSNKVREVTFNYGAEMLDQSVMGVFTRINKGGLKTWSFDATFVQDFSAGSVDATLWPLVGTSCEVVLKPVNAGTTDTNPSYTGTAVIDGYNQGGAVGVLHEIKFTFQAMDDLTRSTTAT